MTIPSETKFGYEKYNGCGDSQTMFNFFFGQGDSNSCLFVMLRSFSDCIVSIKLNLETSCNNV